MKRTATIAGACAFAALLTPGTAFAAPTSSATPHNSATTPASTAASAAPSGSASARTATASATPARVSAAAAAALELAKAFGLGNAVGELQDKQSYLVQSFQQGDVYWTADHGAIAVAGAIKNQYDSAAGFVELGLPVSAAVTSGNVTQQRFEHGQIVSSPQTGARSVINAINGDYDQLGGIHSDVGLPISNETTTMTGARASSFQSGTIIWSNRTGAHAVENAIYAKYGQLGWDGGNLGKPLTDEVTTRSGARASTFENGTILWTGSTGAHAVINAMYHKYGELGWESGRLGMPLSEEHRSLGGRLAQDFQGGTMIWTPAHGARMVTGAIRDRYARLGWDDGRLGAPTTDEYQVAGGWEQQFEHGWIRYVNGSTTDSTSALKSSPTANGNRYGGGTCVWYAYNRRAELGAPVGSLWGNGGQWADSARREGFTVDHTPQVGAVISTYGFGATSGYGHVAVVEKINPDGSFTVSEMNSPRAWVISYRTFSAGDASQLWFIH